MDPIDVIGTDIEMRLEEQRLVRGSKQRGSGRAPIVTARGKTVGTRRTS